ncbi:Small GTPase superfamily [Penicillium digitatum]|uniref:Small GTPase superfamily n=1 Tax=Penicillium digitatum TaxID=36651 RepID=A0A7T6XV84_PENDI|nr:Small GTPase superfamily [Penicillium digitatum]
MDKISMTICGDGGYDHEHDPTITVARPFRCQFNSNRAQMIPTPSPATSMATPTSYPSPTPQAKRNIVGYLEAEQRVEDKQRLRQEFKKKSGVIGDVGQSGLPPPVKIVVGNKCDLKDNRAVTSRDGLLYAHKHGCGFMETSACETVNIEETFAHLVRRVVEARRLQWPTRYFLPNVPSYGTTPYQPSL